ncbi:MAG: hypothetical protein LBR48_07210 [Dysgonamonadaceae bacterium]|jgi:hypothetical protein|nr:hypothetical protein [Dysgonamonadaceae bacterium]
MKFTTKLLLFWVSVFLIFYLAVMVILLVSFGVDANLGQLMLVFSVTGVLPPMLITAFFSKKLDYMESENINPPTFRGQKKEVLAFKPRSEGYAFHEVWQIMDRNWIISFSDTQNRVLKFRTDSRIMSWGIGGYVRLTDDNYLEVIVYPIFESSKDEELIMNQTLQMMKTLFDTPPAAN